MVCCICNFAVFVFGFLLGELAFFKKPSVGRWHGHACSSLLAVVKLARMRAVSKYMRLRVLVVSLFYHRIY
jgi:hypothetical protein